jgi:hypothetical protein
MVAASCKTDHVPVSPAEDLLDQTADRAYMVIGPCGGRLARAAAIVRSGGATLLPSGSVLVSSQAHADRVYTVNGSCPCPDAQHTPEGRCKHLLASWLVRRVYQADQVRKAEANRLLGSLN